MFKISNAISINGMFGECINLISLDLSNFDTSNVSDMGFMFDGCNKLKQIKGINNFDTQKVKSMHSMFQNCYELEVLDLSSFDTSNVTDMKKMFNKCYKLKKIKGINNFKISYDTNITKMFQECDELEYLNLSKFDSSINKNYNGRLKNKLDEEKNKNLKLIRELNREKKKVAKLSNINEKIIAVNFRTTDQLINYPMAGKSSEKFSTLEAKLYEEFPDLRNKNLVFIANGNVINISSTLQENKIKSGTTIIIQSN